MSAGSDWFRSVTETEQLLEIAQPHYLEPVIYRNRKYPLIALVYRDAHDKRRHLVLAVARAQRSPTLEEALEARAVLLPQVADFAISPDLAVNSTAQWMPQVQCLHVAELRCDYNPHATGIGYGGTVQ